MAKYKPKYKSKRLSAADKALNQQRVGDRPEVDEHDQVSLARGLNWFNAMFNACDDGHTRAYDVILQYLIDSGAIKSIEKWTTNKAAITKRLNSHYWGMGELISSGEITDATMVNKFRRQIKELLNITDASDDTGSAPQIKVLSNKDLASRVIAELESEWDSCMELIRQKKKPKFSYAAFAGDQKVTAEIQEYIKAFYKTQHQEIVDAYKGRIEGYESYSQGQLKVMIEILTDICSYKPAAAPVTATLAKRKSYYKPKGQRKVIKTKGGRKQKTPPPFDAKSAVVIYFPTQKQIAVLHAESGTKLILKRKTIQNVDLNKSYVKRFGKQRDMVTNLKRSKFDKVAQFVGTISSAKMPATTRLREGAIVVSMKD